MRTPTVGSRTQRTPDTENDELSELAEVLTVTAKKLAAVTLGRRFTGGKNRPLISDSLRGLWRSWTLGWRR